MGRVRQFGIAITPEGIEGMGIPAKGISENPRDYLRECPLGVHVHVIVQGLDPMTGHGGRNTVEQVLLGQGIQFRQVALQGTKHHPGDVSGVGIKDRTLVIGI